MRKKIEERIICEDERHYRYEVVKLRHYHTKTFGDERIEYPGSYEWALLEGMFPGRGVNEVEDGTVFEIVVDGTIIRRVDDV